MHCWPVTCVDLYHCEAVGRFIVDQDIGHDMESLSASARKGLCLQASRHLVPLGKRLFDGNEIAVELVRVDNRSAQGVLPQEIRSYDHTSELQSPMVHYMSVLH